MHPALSPCPLPPFSPYVVGPLWGPTFSSFPFLPFPFPPVGGKKEGIGGGLEIPFSPLRGESAREGDRKRRRKEKADERKRKGKREEEMERADERGKRGLSSFKGKINRKDEGFSPCPFPFISSFHLFPPYGNLFPLFSPRRGERGPTGTLFSPLRGESAFQAPSYSLLFPPLRGERERAGKGKER